MFSLVAFIYFLSTLLCTFCSPFPTFPCEPPSLCQPPIRSVSTSLDFLDSTHKWTHTVFVFLWRISPLLSEARCTQFQDLYQSLGLEEWGKGWNPLCLPNRTLSFYPRRKKRKTQQDLPSISEPVPGLHGRLQDWKTIKHNVNHDIWI